MGTLYWYAAATGGSSLGFGTSFTTPTISVTTTYYVIVGALMLNTPLPVFNIVNILVNGVDPKSVKSVAEGVRSPSAIEVALPCTSISGYTIVAITAVLEDEVQVPLKAPVPTPVVILPATAEVVVVP